MTPEEIKAGIAYCMNESFCQGCPIEQKCKADILSQARALIEHQEEQIALMKVQMHGDCGVCKHRHHAQVRQDGPRFDGPCHACIQQESRPAWEYEGLPEARSR